MTGRGWSGKAPGEVTALWGKLLSHHGSEAWRRNRPEGAGAQGGEEWRDQAEAQHRAGCNLSAGRAGWFRAGERRPVSVTSSIRLLGRKLTVEGVVVSEGPSGRESHSPSPDPWFLASKAPLVGE